MTVGGMMFVVLSMKTGLLESPLKGHTNVDTKTAEMVVLCTASFPAKYEMGAKL